jgi:adenosine/AMP kinase
VDGRIFWVKDFGVAAVDAFPSEIIFTLKTVKEQVEIYLSTYSSCRVIAIPISKKIANTVRYEAPDFHVACCGRSGLT